MSDTYAREDGGNTLMRDTRMNSDVLIPHRGTQSTGEASEEPLAACKSRRQSAINHQATKIPTITIWGYLSLHTVNNQPPSISTMKFSMLAIAATAIAGVHGFAGVTAPNTGRTFAMREVRFTAD